MMGGGGSGSGGAAGVAGGASAPGLSPQAEQARQRQALYWSQRIQAAATASKSGMGSGSSGSAYDRYDRSSSRRSRSRSPPPGRSRYGAPHSPPRGRSRSPDRERMGRGSEEGSRPPRDKSTRRVEVRNLPPNLPPMELGTLFNECGERAHTDTEELARGGSVYLHFFDARAAEACVEKMNGKQVGGRSLDVSFMFGNDTSGVEAVNTGTLWIRVRGRSLSHEDMRQRFSQYGALRDVRNARGSLDVFFVEYYDLRDCERAFLQHRDPDVSLEYAKAQGPPSRGGARGGRGGGGRDAPHRGGGGSGGGYGGGAAPSGGFGAFGAGGLGGLTGGGAAPRDPRLG